MNFYLLRFNLYLLLGACALFAGCKSTKSEKSSKHLASMRFYIESRAQTANSGETVTVLRSQPVVVTVNREPILTEKNIIGAAMVDTPGGFAIEVRFDDTGTWTLEQFSSANPGRHLVIFSQWSEKAADSRWLAAPIILKRINNGFYAFTPDASREEAKAIVVGLNNMAKKIAKGEMKL